MTQYPYTPARRTQPGFSIPSIIAIICAIASFFFGAGFGFLLAVIAIVAGVVGVLLSLSPNVRGGMTSIISVIAGAIGIIAAIFKLFF